MLLKKIVVAEDDDAIAHMVNMALGDAGFLCLRARDGEEALRLARTHLPDLLVLDVMMPRVDGHEVARRLKSDVLLSKIPIIMLTALTDVDQKVRGFDSGADDYLTKPFDLREFNARVKALIRAARRERDRNPTTHLPGSTAIDDYVQALLKDARPAAVIQFEMVGFEGYADRLGFARADALVAALGELILDRSRAAAGGQESFVGHLGGVDFIAICPAAQAESLASEVIAGFQERRTAIAGKDEHSGLAMVAAVVPTEGAADTTALAQRMVATLQAAKKAGGSRHILWNSDLKPAPRG
jgi:DNA-binding response OmpR family regulator